MSRDWQSYLGDNLEACQRVRCYSTGLDQSGLVNYPMAYDAVLRNLEPIGEAAKRIPPEVRLKMLSELDQQKQWEPINRRRLLTSTFSTLLIFGLCLFVPAGTWAWTRGWLFFAVVVAAGVAISLYLQTVNPEVIAARVNRHEGTKPWDRWLLRIYQMATTAILPVAAWDDGRFHWSHVPWWVSGIGYGFGFVGLAGMVWALSVNRHFEPTVRIQSDRGHHVIDTGPYALVRHPGYASAAAIRLGVPLAIGSYWAFIPALVSYLLLVMRTILEDRTLQAELPGYKEYAQRVRHRLVPGLW